MFNRYEKNDTESIDLLDISNKKSKDENGKNLHDTEKSIELMQILIENSSQVNDIVLDPFAGIGSTLLACINTGRNYVGFEIDEKYYEIAKERINNHLHKGV